MFRMASECNGFKSGMCIEVNSGRVVPDSKEELQKKKSAIRQEEQRKRATERWERRKKQQKCVHTCSVDDAIA